MFKKMMAKRALKKEVNEIKTTVRKAYKEASKDLTRRLSGFRIPLKVTITNK